MAKSLAEKPTGRHSAIPHAVHRNESYRNLSGNAVKLLLALAYQYNGYNNGDLTAAYSVMHRDHGFRSKATLTKCIKELLEAGLIRKTREAMFQHPNNQCALYALTWYAVHECPGKRLDHPPTRKPLRDFAEDSPKALTPTRLARAPSRKTKNPVQKLNSVRPRNCTDTTFSDPVSEPSASTSATETGAER